MSKAKPYTLRNLGGSDYDVLVSGVNAGMVSRGGMTSDGRYGGWSARGIDGKFLPYAETRRMAADWVYDTLVAEEEERAERALWQPGLLAAFNDENDR